jgi:aspartyl-tRNA(Asn)/glutamyl-tRNA(Gln) amidotransferase subunit A
MRDLLAKPGHELLSLIERGEIDHNEFQQAQYEFAREIDSEINAFITWDETIESQSWELALPDEGPRQFSRLPYAAKDIFTTRGMQTTAGSRILAGYIPDYDATCVRDLRHHKNHLIGKTNMDEFAMGSSGETSAYGITKNPWNTAYVPGGSSSGSAAAVAACQCVMALGTDTGGSVRQPASFCGVVGYRPTYGLISRSGLIAYASSCDQAGLFTRSALDAALAMNTISRPDPLDSTCQARGDVDYYAEAVRDVSWKGVRVGVLKEFNSPGSIEAPVLANFQASLKALEAAGAQITELSFPIADLCLPAYYIITAAECSSNLARYDGFRFGASSEAEDLQQCYREVRSNGFGAEVKRRILLGTYVLSAGYYDSYYDRARQLRRDIRNQLDSLFKQVDVLATPTSPTLPFKFGERLADPVQMYLSDLCTVFVNLAGTAGINIPNGSGATSAGDSLPTGIQFICAPFRDSLLLRIAYQFEKLTGFNYEPPAWVKQALAG